MTEKVARGTLMTAASTEGLGPVIADVAHMIRHVISLAPKI